MPMAEPTRPTCLSSPRPDTTARTTSSPCCWATASRPPACQCAACANPSSIFLVFSRLAGSEGKLVFASRHASSAVVRCLLVAICCPVSSPRAASC